MTDKVGSEQRSRVMAAVRGTDTAPELYVRRQLFTAGFRFRLHAKALAGRPDIVLPRFRTAVFVHGCFWHGHSCVRGKRPTSNVEFWRAKIDGSDGQAGKAQRACGCAEGGAGVGYEVIGRSPV